VSLLQYCPRLTIVVRQPEAAVSADIIYPGINGSESIGCILEITRGDDQNAYQPPVFLEHDGVALIVALGMIRRTELS